MVRRAERAPTAVAAEGRAGEVPGVRRHDVFAPEEGRVGGAAGSTAPGPLLAGSVTHGWAREAE